MTFEDFLDMMSVFSDSAPLSIKIDYAFRIYGNIVMLTNNEKETKTGFLKQMSFLCKQRKHIIKFYQTSNLKLLNRSG